MPTAFFSDSARDERGDESADVNAHIENVERRISAGIVFIVEFADHNGDARFEETIAERD